MKKILLLLILFGLGINTIKAANITENLNSLKNSVDNLSTKIENLHHIDKLYPIGSIYITTDNTNPNSSIGGIWEIYASGRQIIGVGNNGITTYNYNSVGGSSVRSLGLENLPNHTHSITPVGSIDNVFKGTAVTTSSEGSHNHTIQFGSASAEAQGYGLRYFSKGVDGGCGYCDRVIVSSNLNTNLNSSGSHTHTLTPEGTVESTFKGSKTITSSVGTNANFSIQNPYITVYMWKRVS